MPSKLGIFFLQATATITMLLKKFPIEFQLRGLITGLRNCAAIRLFTGLFGALSSTRVVMIRDGRGSNDAGGGTA